MYFLKRKKYPLGVIAPDYKDVRDYQLAEIQPEAVELPEEFLLRDKMTSVQKQNYGTCTSHMADGIAEFWNSQEYHKEIKLSQKFIYHNTKKISGLWDTEGDYVRHALKAVCDYGAPLEASFPDIKGTSWKKYVREEPSAEIYEEAKKYRGKTYWRVGRTLNDFRQATYQNKCPVGFGMMWHKGYNRPAEDGRLSLPGIEVGGHAIDYVGWTIGKDWFRNSWGKDWGLNGCFYIPSDEFDRHTIWDCWVMLDRTEPPAQKFEGYCAIKYLRNSEGYKKGMKVKTIYRLKLRSKPSLKSTQLVVMDRNQEGEIMSDEVINADGYKWQKIGIVLDKVRAE